MRAKAAGFFERNPWHIGQTSFAGEGAGLHQADGSGWMTSLNMSGNAFSAWCRGERPKSYIRKADIDAAIEQIKADYDITDDLRITVTEALADPDLECHGTPHHVGTNFRKVLFIDLYWYVHAVADDRGLINE